MKMYSIPDKNKVSKEEWEAYIERVASYEPTEQDKLNYQLFNDFIFYGEEYIHVDGKGNARRIHPLSDEASEIKQKIYDEENI